MAVRLPTTTWSLPIAGFVGVTVLVLATADLPVPPVVLLTVGLTGMGVVVLAWLGLGRRAADMSVRELHRIAAAWCLPLLFARPLFSGDVHSYHAQGLIAANGLDPYGLGPLAALGADSPVTQEVSHYWQDTPAPYGPVWLAISRTIARLAGENVPATLLLHRLVELAGLLLVAWALPRLARRMGVSPGIALWLGLLNPLVLWHVVGGAHNDGLMIGLVLAGTELVLGGLTRPSRVVAGLALLTVAANIKIVAAVAVCCLGAELARRWGRTERAAGVWTDEHGVPREERAGVSARGREDAGLRPARRRAEARQSSTVGRGLLVLAGVLAGFVVLSAVLSAATGLGMGWLGTLGESAHLHSWLAPTNQLGFLAGGLGTLAGVDITSTAIAVVVRVGAVLGAVAGAGVMWAIFRGRLAPLTGLGLVFAVMLATGPVVQPWYLLWALLPLAASVGARRPLVLGSAVAALLLPPVGGGVAVLVAGYLCAAMFVAVLVMPGREVPALLPRPGLLVSSGSHGGRQ